MDTVTILKTEKQAITIGISVFTFAFLIPFGLSFAWTSFVTMDKTLADALPLIAVSQSFTVFISISVLLIGLKILNTNVDRLALSSVMVTDVTSHENNDDQHPKTIALDFEMVDGGSDGSLMLKNEAYLVGDIGTPIKQSFLRLPEFELLYTVRPEIIVVMIKSCPLFKHGETECSYSSAGSCKLQHCDEIISWCTTCCRATSLYGVTQLSSSLSAFARLFTHVPSSPGPAGTSLQEKVFPKKLGEPLCQYYMRNGDAKFGLVCRYHHPQVHVVARPVLSPVGLPLRPI
ncbi:hypothetical protein RYX36_008387 [Vicia faba]